MEGAVEFETEHHNRLQFVTILYFTVLIIGVIFVSIRAQGQPLIEGGLIIAVALLISIVGSATLIQKDRTEISRRTGGGEIDSAEGDIIKTMLTAGLYLPYYLYSRRKKVRHYQESQSRLPEMRSTWNEANERAAEEKISDAINTGDGLMDDLESAISKYTEVNLQEYEHLLTDVHRTVVRWRMERGNQRIEEARTQASNGDYESAIGLLDEEVEKVGSPLIESFEFTCHESSFSWDDSRALSDDIANKLKGGPRYRLILSKEQHGGEETIFEELAKFVTRAYELRIEWMKSLIEKSLSQSKELTDKEDIVGAIETARTAKETADETVRLSDSSPEPVAVNAVEEQCQRAYDRTIALEQQTARTRLKTAREHCNAGDDVKCIELVKEVEDRLTSTLEFLQTGPVDVDVSPLEKLQRESVLRFVEYEGNRARNRLNRAQNQVDAGASREAITIVQRVANQLEEAIEYVNTVADDVDATVLEDLQDEVNERLVDYRLVEVRRRLDLAQQEAKKDNYDDAISIVKDTKGQTEEILSFASTAETNIQTATIEEVREDAIQQIVDYEVARAAKRLESAQNKADEAAYREAIDVAGEAEGLIDNLSDDEDYAVADHENARKIIDRIDACKGEWERRILTDKIEEAQEAEHPRQTRERLQSVLQDVSKTDHLSDSDAIRLRDRSRELYIRSYMDETTAALEKGAESLEHERQLEALERFDEAENCMSDALGCADEWDVADVAKLENLHTTVREHQAQARTEIVGVKVRTGIEKFEKRHFKGAGETFSDTIDDISKIAERFDQNVLPARLAELEEVSRKNRRAAYDAISDESEGTYMVHRPTEIVSSADRNSIGEGSWNVSSTDFQIGTATIDDDGSDRPAADIQIGIGSPPSSIPSTVELDVEYDNINKKEKIGAGGSGEVYEATVEMGTRSHRGALKEPKTNGTLHKNVFEQFVGEAETWSRLDDNDYIVDVMAYGTDPLPWLLLEYMDGGSLDEYSDRMPIDKALWTARCIADGVCYAHNHGVAHLDLKPENVLLRCTESDTWPVPKIGDWGLVRTMLNDQSGIEAITPAYAAPEQFEPERFGEPDQSTDIYQLGIIFYELLSGQHPCGGNGSDLVSEIVDGDVVPLEEANPDVPKSVNDAVMNALRVDKSERFDHVVYLRDELAGLRDHSLAHV